METFMLFQIRDYIRREQITSNQQVARQFGLDIQTVQPMLELWLRKGVIACCQEKQLAKAAVLNAKISPLSIIAHSNS